jgi:hypothetical protein
MAVLRLGFARATDDVDLLIDGSAENIRRVRQALEVLPTAPCAKWARTTFRTTPSSALPTRS